MRLDADLPAVLDGFLAGRPWAGPIPEGPDLFRAMRRPEAFAEVLSRHAAERLAAFDLSLNDGMVIGSEVLLPLAAAAQLEQVSFGPKGLLELAASCAEIAEQRGLARNLAEDALCSLAAVRLPPLPPPGSEETIKSLRRLSPWSLLDGDLEVLEAQEARTAGEWLAERALPGSERGRFPLRKLLLQPLTARTGGDSLPLLGVLARILQPVAASRFSAHLADFYECYCGWMETCGPRDAHARRILQRLDLRDVESERRSKAVAAGAFFVLLARLDPAAARRAPRLHRDLLQTARYLAGRLPETTS